MDPSFIDDYHAAQNLDHAIGTDRLAAPPWVQMMQAHAGQGERDRAARQEQS